jgi:hypothetical protein
MANSNELFYLSPLNVNASSSPATLSGFLSNAFTGDAVANVDITLSTFKSLYQFQTDSVDINDVVANDVKFRVAYVDASNSPLGMDIDTSAVVLAEGAIDGTAGNKNITYDYTRYLALKLFNSHLGVDLFSNEQSLRAGLNTSFKTRFNEVLLALAARGATDQNDNSVSGTHYNTTSPSRIIFNQLIANKPSRFRDINSNKANIVDGKQWYYMPGAINDKFFFLLNVAAAENQHVLTGVSTPIPVRSYLISAKIIADPTVFTYSDGTTLTINAVNLTSSLYTAGGRSASQLVSVTVGPSCIGLSTNCFNNCTNLTSIIIPNSVKTFGDLCFYKCSKLSSIIIPDSVTAVKGFCFAFCSSLTSIIFPNSVSIIGGSCFQNCSSLVSVILPINSSFKYLDYRCFWYCTVLTGLIIPDSIETIAGECFSNCPALTSIIIPSAVKTIGENAFIKCQMLNSVTFNKPSTITVMPSPYMLSGIPGPITVTFKNTVNYAALNSAVSTYFTQVPPANCASPYIFNA